MYIDYIGEYLRWSKRMRSLIGQINHYPIPKRFNGKKQWKKRGKTKSNGLTKWG